jgi:hypothetical protein
MKIAMWSGPRNLSTAMMYSFGSRPDCAVWDEPFYAAYLAQSTAAHPMRDEILRAHEPDPTKVAARCSGPIPDAKSLFYMKHMPHHMLPSFDLDWARSCVNVFLIRHPVRVVASYAKKREGPTLDDLGYVQQARLFKEISNWGRPPLVVDSTDIRSEPERLLRLLCSAIGLEFMPQMLQWPAGGHADDGVWARHWYGAVHLSTGFDAAEAPMPKLEGAYARLAQQALPFYEELAQRKMG